MDLDVHQGTITVASGTKLKGVGEDEGTGKVLVLAELLMLVMVVFCS